MLFPEIGGLQFHHMEDSRLSGQEVVDGHTCYKISSAKWNVTFWIDTQSMLLIKMFEQSDEGVFPPDPVNHMFVSETTTYASSFNAPVDDKIFLSTK